MSNDTKIVDKGLKAFIKAMKNPPYAKVGIIAGKSKTRTLGAGETHLPTNAEVGAAHEFGAPARGLPMRSWLRMPINTHLQAEIAKAIVALKKEFAQAKTAKTLVGFVTRLGIAGEAVCKQSFTNGGWGQWKKLSQATLDQKTTTQILVETTQLRESIASEVVK